MGHRRRLVPRRVVALHPQPAAAADQRAVIIDHAPIEQDRAIADAADRAALDIGDRPDRGDVRQRSEEHTSELQSLMRISYAVFCLKKQNTHTITIKQQYTKYSIS